MQSKFFNTDKFGVYHIFAEHAPFPVSLDDYLICVIG